MQNPSQIHQVGTKNPPIWDPNSFKIGPRRRLGEVLGWSGAHVGSKTAPRTKKSADGPPPAPPWTLQVGPQNHENSIFKQLKRWSFFWLFFGSMLSAVWNQLGPILAPQILPKWSHMGTKIPPNWGMVLRVVFWTMLGRFLLIFWANITLPT